MLSKWIEYQVHYKANVNCKRVSGHIKADKTCGRAVIIFHYFTSTFPVQF